MQLEQIFSFQGGKLWKIIVYSRSIINACSFLSHEWWVPLIKFMVGPTIYVRRRSTHLWYSLIIFRKVYAPSVTSRESYLLGVTIITQYIINIIRIVNVDISHSIVNVACKECILTNT